MNDDLKERVLAAAAASPSPTRAATNRRGALWIAGGAATMAAGYWVFAIALFGWQHVSRSMLLLAGTSIGAAVVAGIAVSIALRRGGSMLGRSRRWLIASTVLAPLVLLGWKIGWSALFGNLDESPRLGYRCLVMSFSMGTVPVLLLAMTRKGEDPRHPGLLGAAIGVAVGACAWVLVDLWCPVAGIWHLLRGHVLPMLLLGIVGATVGSLMLGVRSRR
jgi:hypothetical protein